jgi:hypothetical protein
MARPDQPLDGDEQPRESSSGPLPISSCTKAQGPPKGVYITLRRSSASTPMGKRGFAGVALTRLALKSGRGMASRPGLWTMGTRVWVSGWWGAGSVRASRGVHAGNRRQRRGVSRDQFRWTTLCRPNSDYFPRSGARTFLDLKERSTIGSPQGRRCPASEQSDSNLCHRERRR